MKDVRFETERLILRQARPKEAAGLAKFFKRNEKFLGRRRPKSFYSAAFWRKQIARERKDFRTDRGITLYLFLKSDPREIIGEIVLDEIVRKAFQSCFLGYLLGERYEGQGYMSEALKGALSFAFDEMNLHRISAAHVPANKRSCRVMKRAGFKVVGLERDYLWIDGRWRDHEVHVLHNPKWRPRKA